jgi:hypothetical protein
MLMFLAKQDIFQQEYIVTVGNLLAGIHDKKSKSTIKLCHHAVFINQKNIQ